MKRVFTIIVATIIGISAITTMAQIQISYTPELKQKAEKGDAEAQFNLGNCYISGCDKDYKQAVYWFEKAAKKGYAEAQCMLGSCYYYGESVAQDYKQAAYWYEQSAKQDNAAAQFCLGACFANGQGVPQDLMQAVYWFEKAAKRGHDKAKEALENIEYFLELKQKAEKGDAEAQYELGNCYISGFDNKDYKQAVYWWEQAAKQGHVRAQFNLGNCYKDEIQDYNQAAYWLKKAAEQGHVEAKKALEKIGND